MVLYLGGQDIGADIEQTLLSLADVPPADLNEPAACP